MFSFGWSFFTTEHPWAFPPATSCGFFVCFSCYSSSQALLVRTSSLGCFPCYCSVISLLACHLQTCRFSGSGKLPTPFQSSGGPRDTSSIHSLIKLSISTASATWSLIGHCPRIGAVARADPPLLVVYFQSAGLLFRLSLSFPNYFGQQQGRSTQLRARCSGFWKETRKDICSRKPQITSSIIFWCFLFQMFLPPTISCYCAEC